MDPKGFVNLFRQVKLKLLHPLFWSQKNWRIGLVTQLRNYSKKTHLLAWSSYSRQFSNIYYGCMNGSQVGALSHAHYVSCIFWNHYDHPMSLCGPFRFPIQQLTRKVPSHLEVSQFRSTSPYPCDIRTYGRLTDGSFPESKKDQKGLMSNKYNIQVTHNLLVVGWLEQPTQLYCSRSHIFMATRSINKKAAK